MLVGYGERKLGITVSSVHTVANLFGKSEQLFGKFYTAWWHRITF